MSKLSKVTKIAIKPSFDITIKHTVTLGGGKDSKTKQSKPFGYSYEYNTNGEEKSGLMFETFDNIIFESNITKNKENRPLTMSLSYGEIHQLTYALEFTKNWLLNEGHRVFSTDAEGQPNGIVNSKDFTATIQLVHSFDNNLQMAISPFIISDTDGIKYRGVIMKTPLGILGTLTEWEFFKLYYVVYDLAKNLYTSSMMLAMMGMIYKMKG